MVTCLIDDRMLERIDLYPETPFHQIIWFLWGILMSEVSLSLHPIWGRVIASSILSGPGSLAWIVPEPGAYLLPPIVCSLERISMSHATWESHFWAWSGTRSLKGIESP
jgi:hypothetical protein